MKTEPRLLPLLRLLHPDPSIEPQGQVDWTELLQPMILHRFAGLVATQSKKKGVELPQKLALTVAEISKRHGLRALTLKAVLIKVLKEFQQSGVECVPLKGAHLALNVYPSAHHRYSCDIDLLVRERDVFIATQALEKAGFHPQNPDQEVVDQDHHTIFVSPLLQIPIELHWKLHGAVDRVGQALVDPLWDEVIDGTLVGTPTKLMAPHQLIPYLCTHATRHHLDQGPIVLIDLVYLIHSLGNDIDWRRVQVEAAKQNAQHSLALILASLRWIVPELTPEVTGGLVTSAELGYLALEEMFKPETPEERRVRTILTLTYLGPTSEAIARQYGTKPSLITYWKWIRDRIALLAVTAWTSLQSREGRRLIYRRVLLHDAIEGDLGAAQTRLARLMQNLRRALLTVRTLTDRVAGTFFGWPVSDKSSQR